VLGLAAGAAAAWAVVWMMKKRRDAAGDAATRGEAERILSKAREEAKRIARDAELEAKQARLEAHQKLEDETGAQRADLTKNEERLRKKEENLDRRNDLLARRDLDLQGRQKNLDKRETGVVEKEERATRTLADVRRTLEKTAQMTQEEARRQLEAQLVDEARVQAAAQIRAVEERAREDAAQKAKQVVAAAIQRYAGEYVQERTVSVVHLPSDDLKGRIIGREGRNIRAIEAATGCDLIIDDTPEAVVVSGFDPVRREIAKRAMERLILDGRIHPTKIEELVEKTAAEMDTVVMEAGEKAILELGLARAHPEITRLLGKLKFRTSFAQNLLLHSIETGYLAGLIAGEIGVNVKLARRAGLLHDIGKASDQQIEGPHGLVGAQVAKKFGEKPLVVQAIGAHHEDAAKPENLLDHIVAAANVLSTNRPGARREQLDTFVKRLEQLEGIPKTFPGVERAFAIQAGREVRVMVLNDKVSDEQAVALSRDIAKKIEEELAYPGQIRVSVVRETRAIEYAK
jgi:ribonuclease Y